MTWSFWAWILTSKQKQPKQIIERRGRPWVELLESRDLLSGVTPDYLLFHHTGATPNSTAGPTGTTPAQIRQAYGFNQISFSNGTVTGDGSGTTIAIVDAYDDPNVANDLQKFDAAFGLPNPVFTKVNQTGGGTMPAANGGWASEIALDVEWAHAIAPKANILLVEANDASYTNLFTAVSYAAKQPGVVTVSMSWGGRRVQRRIELRQRLHDTQRPRRRHVHQFLGRLRGAGILSIDVPQCPVSRRHDAEPQLRRQHPQRIGLERQRRRHQRGRGPTELPARRGHAKHHQADQPGRVL